MKVSVTNGKIIPQPSRQTSCHDYTLVPISKSGVLWSTSFSEKVQMCVSTVGLQSVSRSKDRLSALLSVTPVSDGTESTGEERVTLWSPYSFCSRDSDKGVDSEPLLLKIRILKTLLFCTISGNHTYSLDPSRSLHYRFSDSETFTKFRIHII